MKKKGRTKKSKKAKKLEEMNKLSGDEDEIGSIFTWLLDLAKKSDELTESVKELLE